MNKIEKPWGNEQIIAQTEKYVGKIITVRAGHRLSLQYHVQKDETMYFQSGNCKLQLGGICIEPRIGESIHIPTGYIHRLTAITDCVIIEISTPELGDVVRIEDDYGR